MAVTAAGPAAAQADEFPLYSAIVEDQAAPPIPAINLALETNGMEVAADTTDELGYAELPAGELGEYGVSLQDPVPTAAFLLVVASGQEWGVELNPGRGAGPLVEFPAEAGEIVKVWLVALDENYTPKEQGEPVELTRGAPPIEATHADPDPGPTAGPDLDD